MSMCQGVWRMLLCIGREVCAAVTNVRGSVYPSSSAQGWFLAEQGEARGLPRLATGS